MWFVTSERLFKWTLVCILQTFTQRYLASARSGTHVRKGGAVPRQFIQIRRDQMVITQCANRIVTLLVGDDENNVRTHHGMGKSFGLKMTEQPSTAQTK